MKQVKIVLIAFLVVLTANAQEKKINFNSGTLKICSSKNFQIEGYDGKEVIIKSLHNKRGRNFIFPKGTTVNGTNVATTNTGKNTFTIAKGQTSNIYFLRNDDTRKKGLKKLGKNQEDKELGIYFTIEQKNGELIFKDNTEGQVVMYGNESYSIKVPNSVKINWNTSACNQKSSKSKNYVFYNSKVSSLSNFDGEVEVSSSLNNLKLTDVTGPVSINSIGGNVTVVFDKKRPLKLYSIYSNNGFIDITLPENSDVDVDANASGIFSDIDFKVLEDKEVQGLQQMKLRRKNGKVKLKLEAGYGNIYLRKK